MSLYLLVYGPVKTRVSAVVWYTTSPAVVFQISLGSLLYNTLNQNDNRLSLAGGGREERIRINMLLMLSY